MAPVIPAGRVPTVCHGASGPVVTTATAPAAPVAMARQRPFGRQVTTVTSVVPEMGGCADHVRPPSVVATIRPSVPRAGARLADGDAVGRGAA